MLLIVFLLYLRKKVREVRRQIFQERQQMIQEIEKLERENWLRKARGEDSESILKKRLTDLNIDPSTKNLDTLENRVKVGLEIKLADLKAKTAEFEGYNNPRFFNRFSMLPYAMQKDLLDYMQSVREKLTEHQGELEEGLYKFKDRLPEIQGHISVMSEAFHQAYKALDYITAEFSHRISEKKNEPEVRQAAEAVAGAPDTKDDLPTLEKKYSPLKDSPSVFKKYVARLRRDEFREAVATLKEQRKNYATALAAAPLARKRELLGAMHEMQEYSANYRTIFQKYLGEYSDLLGAAQEYDEALGEAVVEIQELIDHPELAETVPKEVTEFIERSLPRQSIMTVNDIVVAYENRYDSIQNLIRGILSPTSIREKITEILTANPDANLRELENALGIRVISVQRKGRPSPSTASGIIIGSEE